MVAFDARLSGTAFASQALMFILGSTLLHSTVCVLNDICDIDLDRQVGAFDPWNVYTLGFMRVLRTNEESTLGFGCHSSRWRVGAIWIHDIVLLRPSLPPEFYCVSISCSGWLWLRVNSYGNFTHRRRHIAIIDLFPLHTLYPLMKRWTYWPQAWLGKKYRLFLY